MPGGCRPLLPSGRPCREPSLRWRPVRALSPRWVAVRALGVRWVPVRALRSVASCALLSVLFVFPGGPAPSFVSAGSLSAQPLPGGLTRTPPGEVGMSADALARATARLQEHVDRGDIAGVVAAVVRDGRLIYLETLGHMDREVGASMPPDALFRVYSMTRPVTSLAILMLHDEGRLRLDDPVQRWLPAFAGQRVLTSPESNNASDSRPRVGDVTLAHLLTHTSGIGSRSSALYRAHEVHGWDRTLAEVVDRVAAVPLFDDPGTAYRYGMSAEILGRVIEEASGMPLEDFLRERILLPLGMTDSSFRVEDARRDRLAVVYRPDPARGLVPVEMETIPVTERRILTSSGVGLVSSTLDFLRFSQFLLDDGVVDGRRLLSPEGVRRMMENAVPEALLPLGERGYWAGSGWTLGGMAVALDPAAYSHPVRRGEVWWDGSAGTRFWIDPVEDLVIVVMAQVSPAGGNGFREGFRAAVEEAILERRGEPGR